MSNADFQRIYRETVGRSAAAGITRQDAIEEASALILTEIRAGRMAVDVEKAVRRQLVAVDESDGRSADQIIKQLAGGASPITGIELDLVVTLGKGYRKQWGYVNAADLTLMNELRHDNAQKVWSAYEDFNRDYRRLLPVLFEHGDVQTAFEAGAFEREQSESKAA